MNPPVSALPTGGFFLCRFPILPPNIRNGLIVILSLVTFVTLGDVGQVWAAHFVIACFFQRY